MTDDLPTSRLPRPFRALRHRNFRLFFFGQLVSLTGTWMQTVAQGWLVYRLSRSPWLLGVVGFAGMFPGFLLGPLGGVVADRFSRHRTVTLTQTLAMVQAFVLAGITLAGWVQVWHVLVLALCMGVIYGFDIPTRQSFLVEMTSLEDLPSAIGLNSSAFNGARVLGPAVAGILVATLGEGLCFLLNGVSYLAVIGGLLAMRLPPRRRSLRASTAAYLKEGMGYAFRTTHIRGLLWLIGVTNLAGMPYTVLMPVFADQILHGGPRGLGLLLGATGAGALVGGMILAGWKGLRGLGRLVAWAAGIFGAALILFSLSRVMWLSLIILVLVGCAMMTQNAATNTLLQSLTPDALRGRIMSFYAMAFLGMSPLGSLLAGAIAAHLGAPTAVALGGGCCVLGAAIFAGRLPVFREAAREALRRQGQADATPEG